MGRLNFSMQIQITPDVSDAAIINLPNDTVEQLYFVDGTAYKKTAQLTSAKDYENLQFGDAAALQYDNVIGCSIKSFPQFGSYGFITQQGDVKYSTVLTDI